MSVVSSESVVSNFFSQWEIEGFRKDESLSQEFYELEVELNQSAKLLNWSKHESEEVPTLAGSSDDVILRLAMQSNAFEDLEPILNAGYILTSNFPTELPNGFRIPTIMSLSYQLDHEQSAENQFAACIAPNLLRSSTFIPVLANSICMSSWVYVIPNYQFSVKNEFNLLRLLYALQRDIFLAYRDEFIIEKDGEFMQNSGYEIECLTSACLDACISGKMLKYAADNGSACKIKSDYLIEVKSKLCKYLSSLNASPGTIQNFNFSAFRKLTPKEMSFLPTCLVLLESVVKIAQYKSFMENDLAKFKTKATGEDAESYSFKASKLESALIVLDRLLAFRNELLKPSKLNVYSLE